MKLEGPDGPIAVRRSTGGVLEVRADTELGRAFGLGWGHARDRIVQLTVSRIAGAGRAAELLQDTDGLVKQDSFIRRRGFARAAEKQAGSLTPRARAIGEAYAAGINRWLDTRPRPLELVVLGLVPEPWTVADSLLVALLQSYLGLAQSQEVAERFIAQIGRSGDEHAIAALRALFAPHLDHWDPALLAEVQLEELDLPFDPLCASSFRAPLGSNAYVVPPGRSASGSAVVAGEPHLDTTWLPPSFVEAVLLGPDTIQAGVTVPGVPGVLAGRWTHVAAAITYGFVDQIDLFVEEVRGGTVRRGEAWEPLERLEETIARRGSTDAETVTVWRSELGLILGDPSGTEVARTLALRWALDGEGMEDAFTVPFALEGARSVDEARALMAAYPQSFQFTLADVHGSTGIQQCGLAPGRAPGHSGLDPQPGWDRSRWWGEPVPPDRLFGHTQGPSGADVLVTANETTNAAGGPTVVNLGLARDRRDRIAQLLEGPSIDGAQLRAVLQDRRSLGSLRVLDGVRGALPDNRQGRLLAAWDGVYAPDREEPSLFARFEATWLLVVFGPLFDLAHSVCPMPTQVAGAASSEEDAAVLWSESNSVTTNVPAFREALLKPEHAIFDGRDWESLLADAMRQSLSSPARPWRETNRIRGAWFLFSGNRLADAPVTSREIALAGAMDTPEQGRIHRIAGRVATVAPVWRMQADLGERALHTALAGGPSDRLLSPRRRCDLGRFQRYELKKLPLE